jgi:hypothetical protein
VAEEGEEGAAFSVVALLLAVCGCRGFSCVDEIGRRRTTVGVWEPARRGGARRRLRGHPENRQDVDRWVEEKWEGRPEPRGLEGAVREGGADVQAVQTVGQENQEKALHG